MGRFSRRDCVSASSKNDCKVLFKEAQDNHLIFNKVSLNIARNIEEERVKLFAKGRLNLFNLSDPLSSGNRCSGVLILTPLVLASGKLFVCHPQDLESLALVDQPKTNLSAFFRLSLRLLSHLPQ